MSGNSWIIIGIIASAFAAFALPYGFHLKSQERKVNSTTENLLNIHGDFVGGDKTVNVNVGDSIPGSLNNKSKFEIAKLKIKRVFENFESALENIADNFPKESDALAGQFNSRGTLHSGMHIKAQMDLSTSTKEKLEKTLKELERNIEDVLIENFDKTTLTSFGDTFGVEIERLNKAKSRLQEIYKTLTDSPKSWEVKVFKEERLTKDFNLFENP